jgi:predicted ATPase
LAEIRRLLDETRLLTLTGTGGIGKTRLALQAAGDLRDEFENGVFFVSLAPISSGKHIVQTIAEAIGFPLSTEVAPY